MLGVSHLRRSPERFPTGRAGEVELPGVMSQVDGQLRAVLEPAITIITIVIT